MIDTLEYEVMFIRDSVDVLTLAFVNEDEGDDTETVEQIATRRALDTLNDALCSKFDIEDFDEVVVKHTGTLT